MKYLKTFGAALAACSLLATACSAHAGVSDVCKHNYHAAAPKLSELSFHQEFQLQAMTPTWSILEGPVWKDGALYMNHIGMKYFPELENPWQPQRNNPSDLILYRDGVVSTLKARYGANGMTLDAQNHLVTARHFDGSVTVFETNQVLASAYEGKRFNSPNDLVVSRQGNVYMTDPDWQASDALPRQAAERAYFIDKAGHVTAITDGVNVAKPNGIYLSKNERTLFVGGANGLFSFAVDKSGRVDTASIQRQLADRIPSTDGMSRDCDGNLWFTSADKVHVAKVSGNNTPLVYLGALALPQVTNLAFGGADGKTLYATVMGPMAVSLWSTRVAIPGMPF